MTSPVHLRALLQADSDLPAADLLLSATAPMSRALARQAQVRLAAPLLEIYGSTETGAVATRATADTDAWTLLPGITLENGSEPAGDGETEAMTCVSGGHIDQPVPLGDAIEPIDAACFLLHGRKADMIKIAGKRTSLAYLNQQLTAIEGVQDGTFFVPDDVHEDEAAGRVVRLVALAWRLVCLPLASCRRCARASTPRSCHDRFVLWTDCRAMPPASCRAKHWRRW